MKRLKRSLSLLLLAVCLSSFPLVTGMTCSTGQQMITYQTIFGVETAVNIAFSALTDLYNHGKVTPATYDAVDKDYNLFQTAVQAAIVAVQGSTSASVPPALLTQQNHLLSEISTARGSN
jgi:hypothetical protein